MSNEALPVKITVGGVTLDAELKPTRTAKAIYELLPIETDLHSWGEEFYFKIPFIKDHRETATVKVAVGDIAYWATAGPWPSSSAARLSAPGPTRRPPTG